MPAPPIQTSFPRLPAGFRIKGVNLVPKFAQVEQYTIEFPSGPNPWGLMWGAAHPAISGNAYDPAHTAKQITVALAMGCNTIRIQGDVQERSNADVSPPFTDTLYHANVRDCLQQCKDAGLKVIFALTGMQHLLDRSSGVTRSSLNIASVVAPKMRATLAVLLEPAWNTTVVGVDILQEVVAWESTTGTQQSQIGAFANEVDTGGNDVNKTLVYILLVLWRLLKYPDGGAGWAGVPDDLPLWYSGLQAGFDSAGEVVDTTLFDIARQVRKVAGTDAGGFGLGDKIHDIHSYAGGLTLSQVEASADYAAGFGHGTLYGEWGRTVDGSRGWTSAQAAAQGMNSAKIYGGLLWAAIDQRDPATHAGDTFGAYLVNGTTIRQQGTDYAALITRSDGIVATPTFSPVAGAVASGTAVTISTVTSGADIYFTTNGAAPTTASTLYSAPITVSAGVTIKALAVKAGSTDSAVGSAVYTILAPGTVATPTFSPVGGNYTGDRVITISCSTSAASLYYTTDGSTPTTASTPYSAAITITTGTTVIKSLAVKGGLTDSAVASASYIISASGGGGNLYPEYDNEPVSIAIEVPPKTAFYLTGVEILSVLISGQGLGFPFNFIQSDVQIGFTAAGASSPPDTSTMITGSLRPVDGKVQARWFVGDSSTGDLPAIILEAGTYKPWLLFDYGPEISWYAELPNIIIRGESS